MDRNFKPVDIEDFKQQIQTLIQNSIQTNNYDINMFVQFASKTRNQINNTPNSKEVCIIIIIQLQSCLLTLFAKKFKNLHDLDQFFTVFKEYETAAKYLNLACYHIFQNLSQKEKLIFWKIAVCKIIKDNIEYIRSNIFQGLESLLDQIYKKQESEFVHKYQENEFRQDRQNLLKKFQNYVQILLSFSINEVLIQRDINVFDDLCQKLYKFIQNEYEQKYKRWFQVYSVQDYLSLVEREFLINEQLFYSLNTIPQFKTHYQKIMRIIYESLVFKYKNVVLKDERGFKGLLIEFFQQENSQQDSVSKEIIQILRVYSRFQDEERYFIDFKQNFQEFVRNNIEQQYRKETLHHELEKQKSKYKSLVKILGDIYDKFDKLIRICFKKSDNNYNGRYDLEMIVKSELQLFFINLEQSIHVTQKLCDYVHDLMMQMAKTEDQFQIKDFQEEIFKVQKWLLPSVKDFDYYLIITNYRLASRLLNYLIFFEKQHALFHLENEQKIIDQMKQFCGVNKLKKFSKMISETKNHLYKQIPIDFEDDITELIQINKKKWPILYNNDQNVFKKLQIYKDQYLTKVEKMDVENCTKIIFSDTLSFVEIYWIEVEKTLIINCVQAAILFLFNEEDDMKTLTEITESLKLETHQVIFQLDRLVASKILWNDKDSYFLNNSQIEQEVKETQIVIDHNIYENQTFINEFKPQYDQNQDLKYQLDAFILKNLKREKQYDHTQLFDIVSKHFYPISVSNEKFKESLEFLIKYEYMSRDQRERSLYHYK